MSTDNIISVKGHTLSFAGSEYRCAFGRGGFSADKKEGDGCTPVGKFPLRECWYRIDRLKTPKTGLPSKIIHETDGWCDDPKSPDYNKHILIAPPASGGGRGGPVKEHRLGHGTYSTRQPTTLKKAKALRRDLTKVEKKLWYDVFACKALSNFKFRKQMPVGPYIADFVCVEKQLIVEVDGESHAESKGEAHDKKRTAFLEEAGYRVVRFWNHDVLGNLEGVAETIRQSLLETGPPLPPPPAGGAKSSYENLWRDDHTYDLIVPLGYNDQPVVSGKGSAIFLHVAKSDYSPTEGCIALAKPDLIAILPHIDTRTMIDIKE